MRRHKLQLIALEDRLDGDVLACALIQISLFPGMSQAARDAICSITLLLVKLGLRM